MIRTPLICNTTTASLAVHITLTMSGRNVFSESEKTCLMELIIKYKLQKPYTLTDASQSAKKILWQRLTQEFNAIEGNSKRTDVQLKKCWDNLKTRQKSVLTEEKRERMRTSGGLFTPTETLVAEALYEHTDVEIEGVFDSDTTYGSEDAVVVEMVGRAELENLEIPPQYNTPPHRVTPPPPARVTPPPPTRVAPPPPARVTPPPPTQRDTPPHRPVSQQSDFGAGPSRGPRNVRARVIEEEFSVRQQAYEKKEKREEELFLYQKQERKYMMMAAEQTYLAAEQTFLKAKAEKEAAEELVRCNKAKRELAEHDLNIKKFNI